ncbi:MAG: hypothetical protein V1892_02660 [bacterium]
MRRVEIVSIMINGEPAKIQAGGVVGNFTPNSRVEVKLRSRVKTAIVVSRDGAGNYVSRRINEGGEFFLRAVANEHLFLWPINLVQFVWTYHGLVKVMSVAVIRRNKAIKIIETIIFEAPLKTENGTIFIAGGKTWSDLFRLAQKENLLSTGEIRCTYVSQPRIPAAGLTPNTGVIYWWNPTLRGNVDKHGHGGNGYGQVLIDLRGKATLASIVASNFTGQIPEKLNPGTIIQFDRIIPVYHYEGHNPRLSGIRLVKTQ